MTPEEKAKELIKKFTEPTQQWNEIERVWEDSPDNAKECALIAVDEILVILDKVTEITSSYFHYLDGDISEKFWHQVKEHINKLQ